MPGTVLIEIFLGVNSLRLGGLQFFIQKNSIKDPNKNYYLLFLLVKADKATKNLKASVDNYGRAMKKDNKQS